MASNKSVYDIAKQLQTDAERKANTRSGDINKLKGNITNAQFGRRGNASNLNKDHICQLDKDIHTNDGRLGGNDYEGPCTGKGGQDKDRFVIGKPWLTRTDTHVNHTDVLFPPRRLDMCTSNLEYLGTNGDLGPLKSVSNENFNHSFFGDVLLAAKYEGEFIKNHYNTTGDHQSICRAMKYSFADLGDIIRGRDIWTKESGNANIQKYLTQIFKRIKGTDDIKGNTKYASDSETNNPPFKQLREDWWEANRKEIWKAMTCEAPEDATIFKNTSRSNTRIFSGGGCGRADDPPFIPSDDYIPQKLRWLSEWSESYCKQLRSHIDNSLKEACIACKNDGNKCMKDNSNCKTCSEMCSVYNDYVNKWQPQWGKQKDEYGKLYKKATGSSGGISGDPIQEQLDDFMKRLKTDDGSKKYENLADIVESMRGNRYCEDIQQGNFKDQNSIPSMTSGSSTTTQHYAFDKYPHEYDQACKCKDRTLSNTPNPVLKGKLPSGEELCSLSTGNSAINESRDSTNQESTKTPCGIFRQAGGWKRGSEKTGNKTWECNNNNGDPNKSPCVPPRVQEMCLGYLDQNELPEKITSSTGSNDTDKFKEINNKLLTEVLLTARFEEQELWKLHTERINKTDQTKDRQTKACNAIKRSFHDLGDIIKGTSIWNDTRENAQNAETQLDKFFKELYELYKRAYDNTSIQYNNIDEFRNGWWETNNEAVWKAFICSSKNKCDTDVPPDDIPQFLRWIYEWSEDFSKEYEQKIEEIKRVCDTNGPNNKCTIGTPPGECRTKCENYKKWINKKKAEEWDKLEEKYNYDQKEGKHNENKSMAHMLSAPTYLNFSCLENTCPSIDYPNVINVKDKTYKSYCDCSSQEYKDREKNKTTSGSVPSSPSASKPSSTTPINICDKTNYFKHCNYKNFKNTYWRDSNVKDTYDNKIYGVYTPPRRQKLCIANLVLLSLTFSDNLEESLLADAKNEAELLLGYYKEKQNVGSSSNSGQLPPGYCDALKRSFADFGDLIKGTNLEKGIFEKKVENKLKEIFENSDQSGGASNLKRSDKQILEERKIWWNQNKGAVWEAMNCKNNKCEVSSGKVPEDDKKPQFLRWLEEWYEDYCEKQQKLADEVKKKCDTSKSVFKCKDCDKQCKEYKDYMRNKEKEWKGQETYYSEEQKKKHRENQKYYNKQNAKEYLHDACKSNICGGDGCKNVKEKLELLTKKPNYDVEEHCGCNKYTKDEIYKDIVGQANCKGLPIEVKNGKIMWKDKNTEDPDTKGTGTIKHFSVLPDYVYVSSRRQRICFQGIDKPEIITNENILKTKLLNLFAAEGKNLGQYYKGKENEEQQKKNKKKKKKEEEEKEKYTYRVEPCSAMKYSFYDLRDIILGNDILEPEGYGTEDNLKKIFKNLSSSKNDSDIDAKRKEFWDDNKECFWEAMKCGYRKGRDEGSGTKHSETELKFCEYMPDDSESPIGKDREDAKNRQFLRWFKEWGEDFCARRGHEVQKLENACNPYKCNPNDADGKKTPCEKACKAYSIFVADWKYEYQQQKKQYDKLKSTLGENKNAHEYLKKNCHSKCSCIDNLSKQSLSSDIPASFDHPPKEVPGKCPCLDPEYRPSGIDYNHIYNKHKPNLPSYGTVDTDGVQRNFIKNDSQDESSNKNQTLNNLMNCVEKSANILSIEAENNINVVKSKFMGQNSQDVYTTKQNSWSNSDICTITDSVTNGPSYSCDANGNPFNDKDKWECDKEKLKVANQDMCLPPRRKHMCTKILEDMDKTTTSEELFIKVLRTAANEGKHLKDKWDKIQDGTKKKVKHILCDAMKYSFADLADIIRGRDNYRGSNVANGLETKLNEVFQNVKKEWEAKNANHNGKYKDVISFRSAWWDANRKYVWEAMTCSAPYDAPLLRQLKGNGIDNLTSTLYKCGHEHETPPDDYIPQGFRWIKEWSENYCNTRKQHLDDLKKECGECYKNDSSCLEDQKEKSCTKCQEKCKSYTEMIEKWKPQWKKQEENYNKLYFSKKLDKNNGENHNKFVEKMNEKCKPKPINVDIFIEKASNCTNVTFEQPKPNPSNQSSSTESSYAFELPPKGYEISCASEYRQSCDNLKTEATSTVQSVYNKNDINGDNQIWEQLNGTIYVPPRTQHLYLKPLLDLRASESRNSDAEEKFSKALQESAYNEGKLLYEYYKNKGTEFVFKNGTSEATNDEINKHVLENMKRSYADYGDLIKGTTEYDYNGLKYKISRIKSKMKYNVNSLNERKPHELWNRHKSNVWYAMLCGYKYAGGDMKVLDGFDVCKLPDSDNTDQFLRWINEWTENFCLHKNIKAKKLKEACSNIDCTTSTSHDISKCKSECGSYNKWIETLEIQYKNQVMEYRVKKGSHHEKFYEYLKDPTKCPNCDCVKDLQNDDDYRPFIKTPKEFEEKCSCTNNIPSSSQKPGNSTIADDFKELNVCPVKPSTCNNYNNLISCKNKKSDYELDKWNNQNVHKSENDIKGMSVPPRRRNMCWSNIEKNKDSINDVKMFKENILKDVVNEAKNICEKYVNDQENAFNEMKNSFADIGNIIKGDDMLHDDIFNTIKEIFENNLLNVIPKIDRKRWWKDNKKHVWHAMLCGYEQAYNTEQINYYKCKLPEEDNTNQFLRWLVEWARQACKEKIRNAENVKNECTEYMNDISKGKKKESKKDKCESATKQYEEWIKEKHRIWKDISNKYDNIKKDILRNYAPRTARRYVRANCSDCTCHLDHLEEDPNQKKIPRNNMIDETIIRAKYDLPDSGWGISMGEWKVDWLGWTTLLQGSIDMIGNSINRTIEPINDVITTILDLFNGEQKTQINPDSGISQFDTNNTKIATELLLPTVGMGAASILGLMYWILKIGRRPKRHVDDMIRILEIPQNEYGIPTNKSSNRYVPYKSSQYKGKTYIYVEGEETDDYIRDISSSDITSSSESEYEEMDINDIYPYKSPKYKTLIEVVLKPSNKTHDAENTHIDHMEDTSHIPSGKYSDIPYTHDHIPTDKFTEEEGNQLKQDFISNMLQTDNMDISREHLTGNTTNTHPNTVDNSMEEKPFITSIHDRFLDSSREELTYNIDWNIPKNINRTNSLDDPKYVSNDPYSGIDLINDSLNGDQHIDIYDELLKRKENELFGTKHPKNTTTNTYSVAKETYSDPIFNQIDLFHKWLNRHRNNPWNSKKDILNQSYEEWNKENNIHMSKDIYDENNHKVHLIHEEYNLNNTQSS